MKITKEDINCELFEGVEFYNNCIVFEMVKGEYIMVFKDDIKHYYYGNIDDNQQYEIYRAQLLMEQSK